MSSKLICIETYLRPKIIVVVAWDSRNHASETLNTTKKSIGSKRNLNLLLFLLGLIFFKSGNSSFIHYIN